ncbi:MAG: alpha/beta hydrolase [Desulfobacterales bacterium]|jgi:lysophospholipase
MDIDERVNPRVHSAMVSGILKAADGCRLRWASWSARGQNPRGMVVLLGGRAEFLEKYEETAAALNQRGFDAVGFDWRGQGMSCRMLPDRRKGHVDSYDDYIDDLDLFFERVAAPRSSGPVGVVAHSMGAHVVLRYLRDHPGRFRWAMLVSPLVDLRLGPLAGGALRILVRAAMALGGSSACVPGGGRHLQPGRAFGGNRLTSDPRRFASDLRLLQEKPALAVDGITFGWLSATFRSIDTLCSPGYPEGIRTPVCIVGGGAERIVSLRAQNRICRRLAVGRYVLIPGARHEILRETDAVRRRFWEIFDRFTG